MLSADTIKNSENKIMLTEGEVLEGYVQKVIDAQKILMNIKGQLLQLSVSKAFDVGEKIALKVVSTGDQILMKMQEPALAKTSEQQGATTPQANPEVAKDIKIVNSYLERYSYELSKENTETVEALLRHKMDVTKENIDLVKNFAGYTTERSRLDAAALIVSRDMPMESSLLDTTEKMFVEKNQINLIIDNINQISKTESASLLQEAVVVAEKLQVNISEEANIEKFFNSNYGKEIKTITEKLESA